MAVINAVNAALASLQKQLDIVASMLLGNLFLAIRPRLVLKEDADTASTDGRLWVEMPHKFCGVGLEDGEPGIFLGLMAHEIGHWLQPIKAIKEVEKETSLLHDAVNIVLDVNCEQVVTDILPLFENPLVAVRMLVRKEQAAQYRKAFNEAKDFLPAAIAALLYCRYCEDPHVSFSTSATGQIGPKRSLVPSRQRSYDVGHIVELLTFVRSQFPSCQRDDLPQKLQELAETFPELCVAQPPDGLAFDPLGGLQSEGEAEEEVRRIPNYPGVPCGNYEAKPIGNDHPSLDVLSVSRQLKNRWVARARVMSVMAPGRLDRQAMLRDTPLPFVMKTSHATGSRDTGVKKIFLAVDWSASMSGDPWIAAVNAARAISLAIKADGGDPRALLFAENAWHAPDFDATAALFASFLQGGPNLDNACGNDTSFTWLPEIWQQFPEHQVLLLTDGAGYLPAFVPPACRKRTSVVLIGLESYDDSGRAKILATADAIAEKVVEVKSLADLVGVWATLIPRRQIA
jgi:hypothetical protein